MVWSPGVSRRLRADEMPLEVVEEKAGAEGIQRTKGPVRALTVPLYDTVSLER